MPSALPSERAPSAIAAGVFRIGRRDLAIFTDDAAVADYLERIYGPAAVPGARSDRPLDRGAIETAGRHCFFNGERLELPEAECGEPFRTGFYASSRIVRETLRRHEGTWSFHAAGVRAGDNAVLIAGKPFAGKTTLALALLERGAQLYSDEFVTVDAADLMTGGVRRTVLVREPALPEIGSDAIHRHCSPERGRITERGWRVWDDVDPRQAYGPDAFADPAPLAAIVVLRGESPHGPGLHRISGAEAAMGFADRFNDVSRGFSRVQRVAALCARVPCYELYAPAGAAAAEVLWEHLR